MKAHYEQVNGMKKILRGTFVLKTGTKNGDLASLYQDQSILSYKETNFNLLKDKFLQYIHRANSPFVGYSNKDLTTW